MNRYFLPAAVLLFSILSCKEKTKPAIAPATEKPSTEKIISYLPVPDLVHDDIRKVDSFAGGILKKTTVDGKKDSVYISLKDFHQLVTPLLPAELDSVSFREHFTETSLMDQSTRLLNFIYTAKDTTPQIRKVIVYIAPALTVDKVDMIYMEKEFTEGDTFVQQKQTWKTGQYFSVITIRQPKQGKASTALLKLIWDPLHFGD